MFRVKGTSMVEVLVAIAISSLAIVMLQKNLQFTTGYHLRMSNTVDSLTSILFVIKKLQKEFICSPYSSHSRLLINRNTVLIRCEGRESIKYSFISGSLLRNDTVLFDNISQLEFEVVPPRYRLGNKGLIRLIFTHEGHTYTLHIATKNMVIG